MLINNVTEIIFYIYIILQFRCGYNYSFALFKWLPSKPLRLEARHYDNDDGNDDGQDDDDEDEGNDEDNGNGDAKDDDDDADCEGDGGGYAGGDDDDDVGVLPLGLVDKEQGGFGGEKVLMRT